MRHLVHACVHIEFHADKAATVISSAVWCREKRAGFNVNISP